MQIEKEIPLPPPRMRSVTGKTAEKMEPGDSVLCATEYEAESLRHAIRARKKSAAVRKCGDGWRVWRTA